MTVVPRRRTAVLDDDEARRLADEGLARAEAAHNDVWAKRFDEALHAVAARKLLVCSDDIWDALGITSEDHGVGSSLGGAFQRAARAGILVPLDLAKRSSRPSQHRGWVGQWLSMLCPSDAHKCLPCAVCVALDD